MMNRTHRPTNILYCLALVAIGISGIACATATGPDGTADVPKSGTHFMRIRYGLNGAGQVDSRVPHEMLSTTAIADVLDPLNPLAVAFADSLIQVIQNDTVVTSNGVNRYRYYPNGDVAIHQPTATITFTPPGLPTRFRTSQARIPDAYWLFPLGTKRDYSYTLLDTIATETFGSTPQSTHFTIVDSVYFLGPGFAPQDLSPGTPPIETMQTKVYRSITMSATVGDSTRTNRSVVYYNGSYSPKYGYMIYESTLVPEVGGTAIAVIPSSLP